MNLQRSQHKEIENGASLGRYHVIRKLATGGMAEIYLARGHGQAGFEKVVVLKRILPQVASDPLFVRMFLDEARLAATLRHPHIADVWEVDCIDGMYFYTMEYIHGQDVRAVRAAARRRNERMPLEIALGIVAAVASALEYAHDQRGPDNQPLNLVHRDISASNIIVGYDGGVKLLDFGIAAAASRSEQTRTGSVKGKVPYMSPEQCQGLRELDRRSDLFSLGTLLYELTVGQRPFRGGSDFVIMEQIVRTDPKRPTELDPTYPVELENIVLRSLERDPEARYQSADEMISDLEYFQASNQLFVSTKVISRYMRSLFLEDIEAWEHAKRQGTSLESFITSIDVRRRNEIPTPPSSFPIATGGDLTTPFAGEPFDSRAMTSRDLVEGLFDEATKLDVLHSDSNKVGPVTPIVVTMPTPVPRTNTPQPRTHTPYPNGAPPRTPTLYPRRTPLAGRPTLEAVKTAEPAPPPAPQPAPRPSQLVPAILLTLVIGLVGAAVTFSIISSMSNEQAPMAPAAIPRTPAVAPAPAPAPVPPKPKKRVVGTEDILVPSAKPPPKR